jgi:anti-anti-sigma factor
VPERDRMRVAMTGELDIATVPALERTIRECAGFAVRHVVLDLRPTWFMSVAGLRSILQLDLEVRDDARGFSLVPGPPAVQRLFHLTRTYELLEFEAAYSPFLT